jgi:hypothetical protein
VSAAEAIQAAHDAGLRLGLDGNDIVLEAPSPPPRAVLDLLARNKASIMRLLRRAKDDRSILHSETLYGETFGQRAANAWAEALARLDPALPPGDVPLKQWLQFIDDCGHFIDNGWALRAAELGWTAFDLFGCDRSKPFARIGRCGLLWLLNGRQLRILTTDTAVINIANGSSVTFYRGPHEPGQVLPWEFVP